MLVGSTWVAFILIAATAIQTCTIRYRSRSITCMSTGIVKVRTPISGRLIPIRTPTTSKQNNSDCRSFQKELPQKGKWTALVHSDSGPSILRSVQHIQTCGASGIIFCKGLPDIKPTVLPAEKSQQRFKIHIISIFIDPVDFGFLNSTVESSAHSTVRIVLNHGSCLTFFVCMWPFLLVVCYELFERVEKRLAILSIQRVLKTVPVVEFKEGFQLQIFNPDLCAICISDYCHGDAVRILNCRHGFHTVCVDKWLMDVSPTCPTCKACIH